MRIYFSGAGGLIDTPEALIPELKPHILLSFYKMEAKGTRERLKVYLKRLQKIDREQIEKEFQARLKRKRARRASKARPGKRR
jgi:hypothetical protein